MLPKQMCRQAVNGTDVPFHFILLPVISRRGWRTKSSGRHVICTSNVGGRQRVCKRWRTLSTSHRQRRPHFLLAVGNGFLTE